MITVQAKLAVIIVGLYFGVASFVVVTATLGFVELSQVSGLLESWSKICSFPLGAVVGYYFGASVNQDIQARGTPPPPRN